MTQAHPDEDQRSSKQRPAQNAVAARVATWARGLLVVAVCRQPISMSSQVTHSRVT